MNALWQQILQAPDELGQNLENSWDTVRQIPNNLYRFINDPVGYGKQVLATANTQAGQALQNLRSSDPRRQMMAGMAGLSFAPAGIFAGPEAATADLAKLAQAHALAREGVHPASIWGRTGWALPGTAGDLKPRFEIPDQPAQVNIAKLQAIQGSPETVPLSEVLNHPELLKAYPQLGKIQVGALPENAPNRGQFNTKTGRLMVDPSLPNHVKPLMLHELQHAVQGIERTSPGGNPGMFEPMHLDDLKRIMQINEQLQMVPPESPTAAQLRAERDGIFADTSIPVNEHAERVSKMRAQHDQEARTYVDHANRGHPEAQAYVDGAVNALREQDPATYAQWSQQLTPKGLQERAASWRLAQENPSFVKALNAWQKARARLSPTDQYRRLGGEAESRLVESRANLHPAVARAAYPYHPEVFKQKTGVPIQELIHLPGSRNSLAAFLGQ